MVCPAIVMLPVPTLVGDTYPVTGPHRLIVVPTPTVTDVPVTATVGWTVTFTGGSVTTTVGGTIVGLIIGVFPTVGSGTVGTGTVGIGTVGTGTVGRGTVGRGTVGRGTVGSATVGRGNFGVAALTFPPPSPLNGITSNNGRRNPTSLPDGREGRTDLMHLSSVRMPGGRGWNLIHRGLDINNPRIVRVKTSLCLYSGLTPLCGGTSSVQRTYMGGQGTLISDENLAGLFEECHNAAAPL
ncbi:MAG: hypothetical protein NVSMB52_09790 [Chloroflexota bacterium]